MRSPLITLTAADYPSLEADTTAWGKPVEVGVTDDAFFVDTSAEAGEKYVYFVEAYGSLGEVARSNVMPAPAEKPPATFAAISDKVSDLGAQPDHQRYVWNDLVRADRGTSQRGSDAICYRGCAAYQTATGDRTECPVHDDGLGSR